MTDHPRPPTPLLLVAEAMEGRFGAAQSSIDVMIALGSHTSRLGIVTRKPPEAMPRLPVEMTAEIDWIKPDAASVAEWVQHQKAPPHVFINSIASHNLHELISKGISCPASSTLIVRESPRHFGGAPGRRTEAEAAVIMARHTGLVFVSSRCGSEWMSRPELAGKRTFHIPNCCREEEAGPLSRMDRGTLRERLGLPLGRTLAICLASLQHRKGQDLLLDAWPGIAASCPGLDLLFAGPVIDWGGGPEIEARINALECTGRVRHLGAVSNPLEYIRAADLLILPARAEAMPRVILEAMTLGTTVIASDVDGIPELIEHEVTGLIFPIADPARLEGLMLNAALDGPLRARLAASASARYWAGFSRARQIAAYGAMLKEIA